MKNLASTRSAPPSSPSELSAALPSPARPRLVALLALGAFVALTAATMSVLRHRADHGLSASARASVAKGAAPAGLPLEDVIDHPQAWKAAAIASAPGASLGRVPTNREPDVDQLAQGARGVLIPDNDPEGPAVDDRLPAPPPRQ